MLFVGITKTMTTVLSTVNYQLHTYTTYENIANTEDEISMSAQPPNKILSQ